jgi:hypothetical protein
MGQCLRLLFDPDYEVILTNQSKTFTIVEKTRFFVFKLTEADRKQLLEIDENSDGQAVLEVKFTSKTGVAFKALMAKKERFPSRDRVLWPLHGSLPSSQFIETNLEEQKRLADKSKKAATPSTQLVFEVTAANTNKFQVADFFLTILPCGAVNEVTIFVSVRTRNAKRQSMAMDGKQEIYNKVTLDLSHSAERKDTKQIQVAINVAAAQSSSSTTSLTSGSSSNIPVKALPDSEPTATVSSSVSSNANSSASSATLATVNSSTNSTLNPNSVPTTVNAASTGATDSVQATSTSDATSSVTVVVKPSDFAKDDIEKQAEDVFEI